MWHRPHFFKIEIKGTIYELRKNKKSLFRRY